MNRSTKIKLNHRLLFSLIFHEKKKIQIFLLSFFHFLLYLSQQGRGGGVKVPRDDWKTSGQYVGRQCGGRGSHHAMRDDQLGGRYDHQGGKGGRTQVQDCRRSNGDAHLPLTAPQQPRGKEKWGSGTAPPGKRSVGTSGNKTSGIFAPVNIQDGKSEALQLCKGHVGNHEQRTVVREQPSFIFGGNLSTVPPTPKEWPQVGQAQPEYSKKIPNLAKALQTAVKETVVDFGQKTMDFKTGLKASRSSSETQASRGGERQEEMIMQLEQRVTNLEKQLGKEKAAKEVLLASVERVLEGELVEEKDFEFKLVRLVHDIKTKVMVMSEQNGQRVSLDLNGNEIPRRKGNVAHSRNEPADNQRILLKDVNTKVRPRDDFTVARQHPGTT